MALLNISVFLNIFGLVVLIMLLFGEIYLTEKISKVQPYLVILKRGGKQAEYLTFYLELYKYSALGFLCSLMYGLIMLAYHKDNLVTLLKQSVGSQIFKLSGDLNILRYYGIFEITCFSLYFLISLCIFFKYKDNSLVWDTDE